MVQFRVRVGEDLYSKEDIMLEYKNTEKGWFFKKRHVMWALFRVSKTAKIKKKGMVFRLIKKKKDMFSTYTISTRLGYDFEPISLIGV